MHTHNKRETTLTTAVRASAGWCSRTSATHVTSFIINILLSPKVHLSKGSNTVSLGLAFLSSFDILFLCLSTVAPSLISYDDTGYRQTRLVLAAFFCHLGENGGSRPDFLAFLLSYLITFLTLSTNLSLQDCYMYVQ